jgi:Predicted nucleotidyltransferases
MARRYANYVSRVPGVRALYITGSLAVNNTKPNDDIDLMVITEPGRLWTTRLLLTLYTELLGIRRRAPAKSKTKWGRPVQQDHTNKLCLNLYLTPDSYLLSPNQQSLYTAYELIQALPLYDPHNTRDELLTANAWLTTYLPNATREGTVPQRNSRLQAKKGSSADEGTVPIVLRLIESLCYYPQLHYMKNKITGEHITKDSAFFHPDSTTPKVK